MFKQISKKKKNLGHEVFNLLFLWSKTIFENFWGAKVPYFRHDDGIFCLKNPLILLLNVCVCEFQRLFFMQG